MTEQRLNTIKEKLQSFNLQYTDVNGTPSITIPNENLLDVCNVLKNDMKFEQCRDAVGVDRFTKKNRFEIIYNLYSLSFKDRLFIRVVIDGKNPESQSIMSIWKGADWYEREAYDMIGIKFTGHTDLRRIYMPEDYEYFPLRKDFPLMGIEGSIPLPNK
jgi:NADH-quinone oxidoreductase subunit C